MEQHLVSIIIPNYNSIEFIEETLNSVFNQTYKNIEIIVVDDGSTDGSFEFIASLNRLNLNLVKNPGKGACAARNFGFEVSKGQYIQYLDADDLLIDNKIESQIKLLKDQSNECIASGIWGRFYNNNKHDVSWSNQLTQQNYEKPYLWLRDSWEGKGMGQTSIWLTHRSLIEKSGGWNESLQINQDGEFFCRVILNAKRIVFSKEAKVFYRSGNPNSISQKNNMSCLKAESLLDSYISYKEQVKNHDLIKDLEKGLAHNFLTYIYQFYAYYPDLTSRAANEFYDLGFDKMWPVGGRNFILISKLIGFKNALRIKRLIKA